MLEFLKVALYRKYIILWTILVSTAVAAAAGMALPKQYRANAKVQIDSIQRNNLTGDVEPRVRVAEFLGQQAAVAGSRTVALAVIDDLVEQGALALADYEDQWRRDTKGELLVGNDLELWAADQLLRAVTIKADALESTLDITYAAENPALAARAANAFASAYMQTVHDQKSQRFTRNAQNFSDETKSLAGDVLAAQRELSEFRERSGILQIGEGGAEPAEVELAALTARLAEARADTSEARSLLRQAQAAAPGDLRHFPLPADAPAALLAQAALTETAARLAHLADRYDETFPDYIEVKRELGAHQSAILSAIRERAEYAASRFASLEAEAAALYGLASAAQGSRDSYRTLKDRLTKSQETFNLVSTRSLQEALQARVDTVEVLLLARAVPSAQPSTPPQILIVSLGFVFGGALAACIAVFAELFEGRVRTGDAARQLLRAPVIGEVSAPKAARKAVRRRVVRKAAA